MPYIIFNEGKSSRWVDPAEGYQLQAGESFSDEPSDFQPVIVSALQNPVEKLKAFLEANSDVAALLK